MSHEIRTQWMPLSVYKVLMKTDLNEKQKKNIYKP
jgi:hypothetical protein